MAKRRKMDFEAMIQSGENPKGMIAQTANGTSKDVGTGWNCEYNYEMPQVEEHGPWQKPRSNRTGE